MGSSVPGFPVCGFLISPPAHLKSYPCVQELQCPCLPSSYQVLGSNKPNCRRKGSVRGTFGEQFQISFAGFGEDLVWAEQVAEPLFLKSLASGFSNRLSGQTLDLQENTRVQSSESVFWSQSAWFECCLCHLLMVWLQPTCKTRIPT